MWLDLPFVQVSRSVEQNVHTAFSFPNPLSESDSLGKIQRFSSHSWWDSTVIFDQTSNSSNVYLSSRRFRMAISLSMIWLLEMTQGNWRPGERRQDSIPGWRYLSFQSSRQGMQRECHRNPYAREVTNRHLMSRALVCYIKTLPVSGFI
jgi:hypothetical protein